MRCVIIWWEKEEISLSYQNYKLIPKKSCTSKKGNYKNTLKSLCKIFKNMIFEQGKTLLWYQHYKGK